MPAYYRIPARESSLRRRRPLAASERFAGETDTWPTADVLRDGVSARSKTGLPRPELPSVTP
jgi:hypothetical protein